MEGGRQGFGAAPEPAVAAAGLGNRRYECRRGRAATDRAEAATMRGALLWLIGIPIPIIILLYLFHVI